MNYTTMELKAIANGISNSGECFVTGLGTTQVRDYLLNNRSYIAINGMPSDDEIQEVVRLYNEDRVKMYGSNRDYDGGFSGASADTPIGGAIGIVITSIIFAIMGAVKLCLSFSKNENRRFVLPVAGIFYSIVMTLYCIVKDRFGEVVKLSPGFCIIAGIISLLIGTGLSSTFGEDIDVFMRKKTGKERNLTIIAFLPFLAGSIISMSYGSDYFNATEIEDGIFLLIGYGLVLVGTVVGGILRNYKLNTIFAAAGVLCIFFQNDLAYILDYSDALMAIFRMIIIPIAIFPVVNCFYITENKKMYEKIMLVYDFIMAAFILLTFFCHQDYTLFASTMAIGFYSLINLPVHEKYNDFIRERDSCLYDSIKPL